MRENMSCLFVISSTNEVSTRDHLLYTRLWVGLLYWFETRSLGRDHSITHSKPPFLF
ncbi:hypothetical protein HanIR_Chr06g0275821 [Helianthus annuus]|nr:hypothetical protein HanIR_Chr06g0275821 [Helianthus annuus]